MQRLILTILLAIFAFAATAHAAAPCCDDSPCCDGGECCD
jgi:hypothetical protein